MASKKNYLIRVWSTVREKIGTTLDHMIETHSDGFDLLQERIIKCYENNIQNLHVAKGLRATYEETNKEEINQSKTSGKTTGKSNQNR